MYETGFSKQTPSSGGGGGTAQSVSIPKMPGVQDAPQAQLEDIHQRFSHQNDRQVELLNHLEGKLHKILNKQIPQKQTIEERGKTNDAIHAFEEQYLRSVNQNDWLEKLVSHISEII